MGAFRRVSPARDCARAGTRPAPTFGRNSVFAKTQREAMIFGRHESAWSPSTEGMGSEEVGAELCSTALQDGHGRSRRRGADATTHTNRGAPKL